jgi:hypothetical protein
MPRKPKNAAAADDGLPDIPKEFLDQVITGPMTQEGIDGLMRKFKKAFIERALGAEMSHHLGYAPGGAKPEELANHRNGSSGKTVLTDDGPLRIEIPRDRKGETVRNFVCEAYYVIQGKERICHANQRMPLRRTMDYRISRRNFLIR